MFPTDILLFSRVLYHIMKINDRFVIISLKLHWVWYVNPRRPWNYPSFPRSLRNKTIPYYMPINHFGPICLLSKTTGTVPLGPTPLSISFPFFYLPPHFCIILLNRATCWSSEQEGCHKNWSSWKRNSKSLFNNV